MLRLADRETTTLLQAGDPDPVERVNSTGRSEIFLTCEHAGRAVPAALGDLGIASEEMDRHIAYDVGAEGIARGISERLDAALVLQRYSRLVIDCNRQRRTASSNGATAPLFRSMPNSPIVNAAIAS